MGTNYYLHSKPDCPTCKRPHPALHIGKSSGGWCFSLRVDPSDGIFSLADWEALWNRPGALIRDEYGAQVTPDEMASVIRDRHRPAEWDSLAAFYGSEDLFHSRNQSERGPGGLLRHRVDGRHCIGHGEGTWDYITGEFS